MNNYNKLGEKDLFTEILDHGWTRKDLYESLHKFTKDSDENLDNEYQSFYLRITGDYDKSLVEGYSPCEYCPDNSHYYRYDDYNELMDDKVKVLVLESKYSDFRKYRVKASYYVAPVLAKDSDKSMIVLAADHRELSSKFIKWIKSFL